MEPSLFQKILHSKGNHEQKKKKKKFANYMTKEGLIFIY